MMGKFFGTINITLFIFVFLKTLADNNYVLKFYQEYQVEEEVIFLMYEI